MRVNKTHNIRTDKLLDRSCGEFRQSKSESLQLDLRDLELDALEPRAHLRVLVANRLDRRWALVLACVETNDQMARHLYIQYTHARCLQLATGESRISIAYIREIGEKDRLPHRIELKGRRAQLHRLIAC